MSEDKVSPHPHKNEIIAWAHGLKIEIHEFTNGWVSDPHPKWHIDRRYRVKKNEQSNLTPTSRNPSRLSFMRLYNFPK